MNGAKRVMWMVVAAACIGTFAMAEEDAKKPGKEHKKPDGKAHFAAMDTDGNGTASLAEFTVAHEKRMADHKAKMGDKWNADKAAKMPTAETIFKKIDTDGNGSVTPEEMMQFHKGRGPEGEGKHAGGPEGKKGKTGCAKQKAKPEAVVPAEVVVPTLE